MQVLEQYSDWADKVMTKIAQDTAIVIADIDQLNDQINEILAIPKDKRKDEQWLLKSYERQLETCLKEKAVLHEMELSVSSSLFARTDATAKIQPTNPVCLAWRSIVAGGVRRAGTENRLWQLHDASWLDGIQTMYNRPCYEELLGLMVNKKAVLIKGSPGIGKRLFLMRVLVDIVENARNANMPLPSIVLALREGGDPRSYWLLCSDGTVEEYSRHTHPTAPQYFLCDSMDSHHVLGSVLHLEVTSPASPNYHSFQTVVR